MPKAPGLLAALDWEGIRDGAPVQTLLLFSLLPSLAILPTTHYLMNYAGLLVRCFSPDTRLLGPCIH